MKKQHREIKGKRRDTFLEYFDAVAREVGKIYGKLT
jgi:chromosome segregation ATPase